MKVLMSAYACEPDRGSEPGAGWTWACAAADQHDVWVLTHATNAESIDTVLAADDRLRARLHPVYVRNARWARPLRRRGATRFLYYVIWQLTACRRVSTKLHAELEFDVCHHITYASDWMPAGVSTLPGLPFVWGPIGGSSTTGTLRIWASLGAAAVLAEGTRKIVLGAARRTVGTRVARRAQVVLGQNYDVARAFEPIPVVVEPNVALDVTPPARDPRGTAPVAVYAGRLLRWKGLKLALDALRRPEVADWRLEIYGDGPYGRSLRRLTRRWKLTDRVRFHGKQPREAVIGALAQADAFLFPSIHDSAGWGVAEAVATGCPVVCLDAGGPPSLLAAGDGIVVPMDSDVVGGLAAGLNGVLTQRPTGNTWSSDRLPGLLTDTYRRAVPGISREGVRR